MWTSCCLSALFLLFAHNCNADYIGAVVEYNPLSSSTPTTTIEENIKEYIYQLEEARSNGVQIIVFPEYGLTGLVESPEGYGIEVPAVGTSDFSNSSIHLLRLSNAAREHLLYVVINILEQENSTNSKTLYYNTNLVFAKNGTLIAKYRKINLFREPKLTPGKETVTFTTDFGTFGLMTCMDILYNHPSQTMLANRTVTDVIYPAAWNSYLPFYMSLEVQIGYALANKVNLLASNICDPENARGGSGIYRSDGTVLRTILTDNKGVTNQAFANILSASSLIRNTYLRGSDLIRDETQEMANYKNITDFQYDLYAFKALDLSKENVTEEICHEKFCCNFNILTLNTERNSSEVYKLAAYKGKATYDTETVHLKHCHLVACLNNDTSTCGVRPLTPYTTKFRKILVWGNFDNKPEDFYRPSSLRGNLQPVINVTYLENRTNESYGVSFNITELATNVVVFGLYGKSGVETFGVSLILMAMIVAIQRIF